MSNVKTNIEKKTIIYFMIEYFLYFLFIDLLLITGNVYLAKTVQKFW